MTGPPAPPNSVSHGGAFFYETAKTISFLIYEFDRKLRVILFAAVARIEVFLRTQFAHYHAEQYGPLGYLSNTAFRIKGHDHTRFMQKINDEIRNNAGNPK